MAKTPNKPPKKTPDKPHQNDDLKAKMWLALDLKKAGTQHTAEQVEAREKVHGSEVVGGAPKLHRRKAGGGGS
jgi:Family of unknown function (DUF5302)